VEIKGSRLKRVREKKQQQNTDQQPKSVLRAKQNEGKRKHEMKIKKKK
jgi:hypothetical protein